MFIEGRYTCEKCSATQAVEKLKAIAGGRDNTVASEAEITAEREAKVEELKQEQLAFEETLRSADATEKKRLLEAKAEDDKHLAALKASSESRRKSGTSQISSDFPTIESAIAEIARLKESINTIESGYEKELTQTRNQVIRRYETQLTTLDKNQRDEFEATDEFKSKQDKKRNDLTTQRDAELTRINTATLSASEISPLHDKIKMLSEREYLIPDENLLVKLGTYVADTHEFPVTNLGP